MKTYTYNAYFTATTESDNATPEEMDLSVVHQSTTPLSPLRNQDCYIMEKIIEEACIEHLGEDVTKVELQSFYMMN